MLIFSFLSETGAIQNFFSLSLPRSCLAFILACNNLIAKKIIRNKLGITVFFLPISRARRSRLLVKRVVVNNNKVSKYVK
jgi:hypothetical protein